MRRLTGTPRHDHATPLLHAIARVNEAPGSMGGRASGGAGASARRWALRDVV